MQALMLAAGMGKRLGTSMNKCMVKVAGKSLFEHSVIAMKNAGISKLIVVTGYNADVLEDYIVQCSLGLKVTFVRNKDYQITNNIWSLYLANEYLSYDDTILLECDLIYSKELIQTLVNLQYPNIAVIAKLENWMDGTTVILNEEYIHKFVSRQEFKDEDFDISYKTVNIYRLSKEFACNHYIPAMSAYINKNGKTNYYEMVLKELVHSKEVCIYPHIIQDKWYEIDTMEDLDIANKKFLLY